MYFSDHNGRYCNFFLYWQLYWTAKIQSGTHIIFRKWTNWENDFNWSGRTAGLLMHSLKMSQASFFTVSFPELRGSKTEQWRGLVPEHSDETLSVWPTFKMFCMKLPTGKKTHKWGLLNISLIAYKQKRGLNREKVMLKEMFLLRKWPQERSQQSFVLFSD